MISVVLVLNAEAKCLQLHVALNSGQTRLNLTVRLSYYTIFVFDDCLVLVQ